MVHDGAPERGLWEHDSVTCTFGAAPRHSEYRSAERRKCLGSLLSSPPPA